MRRAAPLIGLLISAQSLGQNASPPNVSACAAIEDASQRLACYDKLSGRASAPPVAPPAAAAPASNFGLPPPRPVPPPATPPTAPSPQTFGLYAAEHPLPPADPSLTANVVQLGSDSNGRSTVTLEGGQIWEYLDEADPVLMVGQSVTIHRAALGSFQMTTPSKRTHRVRRLR
jgi:hypothetical protein